MNPAALSTWISAGSRSSVGVVVVVVGVVVGGSSSGVAAAATGVVSGVRPGRSSAAIARTAIRRPATTAPTYRGLGTGVSVGSEPVCGMSRSRRGEGVVQLVDLLVEVVHGGFLHRHGRDNGADAQRRADQRQDLIRPEPGDRAKDA